MSEDNKKPTEIETPVVEKYDVETPGIDPQDSTAKEDTQDDYDAYFHDYGFWWKLLSNTLFMIGSVLYVVMSVEALEWYKFEETLPENVRDADDDWTWYTYYNETGREYWEDDYLFQVNGNDGSWVNRVMCLYFGAALCFVLTGILDLWRTRDWFNVVMILAACFGLASSMLYVKNERLSIIFNSVSVHLFALEALYLLFSRHPKSLRILLHISDLFFLVGTVMDCVLSYLYLQDRSSVSIGVASTAAASFWLASSVIYVGATIFLRVKYKKNTMQEATAHDEASDPSNEVHLTLDGSEKSSGSD